MRKPIMTSLIAFTALAGAQGAAFAQTLEPVRVSVSFVGLWDTSQPTFCKERGEFAKAGLDVQITPTRGGSETVQAIIAGGADLGYSPGTSAVLAAYTKGAPIKIVGSEFVGQNDTFFYVPANSPIKTIEDIAGKKVAYPRPGGATRGGAARSQGGAQARLHRGIDGGYRRDTHHDHDGASGCRLFVSALGLDAVTSGEIRVLFAGDVVASQKNISARVNIAHVNFLKNKRDTAKKFFKILDECIDWSYKNPDQSAKMYADINKISLPVAKEALKFYGRDQLRFTPIKGFDESIKGAIDGKFIEKDLTAQQKTDIIDLLN